MRQIFFSAEINGGSKDNVITSANKSVIIAEDADIVKEAAGKLLDAWKQEFGEDEPGLDIRIRVLETGEFEAMTDATMKKVLQFILNCPNGVDEYSRHLQGQLKPQTIWA